MKRRLTQREATTIETLHVWGVSNRAIARTLGVTENTVRDRLARQRGGVTDRWGEKMFVAEAFEPAIREWTGHEARARGLNLAALNEHLVTGYGYADSYEPLQRDVRARYPKPRLQTRRRIETPPGGHPVRRALRKLGGDIRDARLRRRIPTTIMAERASISRMTLNKIEKGDRGVALGNYASVLFVLGLADRLAELADQRRDSVGLALEEERLPQRIRRPGRRSANLA
jgi:DNA-binding XRE family transcriptional regulator/transposase